MADLLAVSVEDRIKKNDDKRSYFQRAVTDILKNGDIPQHVAFIMDGNRRHARAKDLPVIKGHKAGSDKLRETLFWCWELGVKEVTVYAFSIENYKRTQAEVDGLIHMFKNVFLRMLSEIDDVVERGLCVQIVGDWNLMPETLRPVMAKIMILTRHCKTARLNVAICYTGRNEILNGVRRLEQGVRDGDILIDDIDENLLEQSFHLIPSKPLDMLIRTSGETRISDFMIWESSHSNVEFLEVMWPDLSYWDMLRSLLKFQVHKRLMKDVFEKIQKKQCNDTNSESQKRAQGFLEKMRESHWDILKKEALLAPTEFSTEDLINDFKSI